MGIELQIFGYDDPTIKKNILPGRLEPSCLNELNGVGGAQFKLPLKDRKIVKDPTLKNNRNIVKVLVNGNVFGAAIINDRDSIIIGEGEKKAEGYNITGGGLKNWLDDAEVRPLGGLRPNSKDERSFSFASLEGDWYADADWTVPVKVFKVGDVVGSPWRYSPSNWPDEAVNASWVWSQDSLAGAPIGDNFYRLSFPVAIDGKYAFYIAADDQYSVYLDGQLITQSDLEVSSFNEAKKIEMDLVAGDHIIGVRVRNYGGTAALAAALYQYTQIIPPVDHGAVTISIANPAVFTRNAHGLANGARVYLTTTGTLPVGVEAFKEYYVVNRTTNNFRLANSSGGAGIATSGSQSGTHRLISPQVDEIPKLLSFTGMSKTVSQAELTARTNTANTRLATYNALPAGSTSGNKTQKAQAKKKATAKAAYETALAFKTFAQMEYDAANLADSIGLEWKVYGYPTTPPGWSPGEILLTLLEEAAARGVIMAQVLQPSFTATHDSYGQVWGEPLDWSFKVGESLLSVVTKLEELVCDVWVDPETYQLHMVKERGIDRSVYTYDVDGITVLSTPVIFQKGKNLRAASTKSRGKIKNSLSINTATGWLETAEQDAASVAKYGVIEGTLSTGASETVSKILADIVFKQKATEEEGATYDIYPTDSDPIPGVDYHEGDWVLAPNERGELVKRRIMSLSVKEGSAGEPLYTVEFDTIFRTNEDKLARVVAKLGGGGVGSSYGNAGGGDGSYGGPTVVTPPSTPVIRIPKMPTDVDIFSIGAWTANGLSAQSEITISWTPVTQNTDDSPVIPTYYEVWGYLDEEGIDTLQMYARVTEPSAIISPFQPDSEWTFMVNAIGDSGRASAFSEPISHVMTAPIEPMAAPSDPVLSSTKGNLVIHWDGLLAGSVAPPPEFRYVYALVSLAGMDNYSRLGMTISRGGGNITVPLEVGESYDVKLIAVDGVDIASPASGVVTAAVAGIEMPDLDDIISSILTEPRIETDPAPDKGVKLFSGGFVAYDADGDPTVVIDAETGTIYFAKGMIDGDAFIDGTVTANKLDVGSIVTALIASELGKELILSSNESVNILVGDAISPVQNDIDNIAGSVTTMQTFYRFGTDGAVIGKPDSPFTIKITNDQIQMLANDTVVSYWDNGQMVVPSFVGEEVVLGNHKLEKYGTGTVVRAL